MVILMLVLVSLIGCATGPVPAPAASSASYAWECRYIETVTRTAGQLGDILTETKNSSSSDAIAKGLRDIRDAQQVFNNNQPPEGLSDLRREVNDMIYHLGVTLDSTRTEDTRLNSLNSFSTIADKMTTQVKDYQTRFQCH